MVALKGMLDRERGRSALAPTGISTAQTAQPSSLASAAGRLAGIEGLRGLAALGVLTWHVWAHPVNGAAYGVPLGPLTKAADNGRVGVTMFFVLSGFLLYRPFAAAIIRRRPRPSVRRYFRNRVLRIIPAYWAILLIVALLFQQGLLARPLQLLANMFFLQSYVTSYVPTAFHGLGIAPAWSLCVEVVFYLLLPLLAAAGFFLANTEIVEPVQAALAPPALMLVGGIGAIVVTRFASFGNQWRQGFPIHAHWFGIGMLVAVARSCWEDGRRLPSAPVRRVAAGAAIVIGLLAVKLMYAKRLSFEEEQSVLAVSCGVLLALVVLPGRTTRLVRFLQFRPLYLLGLMSYSIFLWHDPILRVLRDQGLTSGGTLGFVGDYALVLSLTFALSALTYRFVERPALDLKRRRRSKAAQHDLAATGELSGAAL